MTTKRAERTEEMESKEVMRALERMFPRVRFTGQQPGEESVERDEEPGSDDDMDEDPEDAREIDEDGERLVPLKEPTHRIPRI